MMWLTCIILTLWQESPSVISNQANLKPASATEVAGQKISDMKSRATIYAVNNKSADQTAKMCWLICILVVKQALLS